ncbi:MAG: UDP-3-O-(3-hydroxymyristoyl)glucosamine N-acyltransferase [Holophagales bacterium]|jgi:UDP-3-O-[3-hydroxymyristoyl] glucosamine N-acyltransferase|nr:UDP-3-O-(3-hydroxymyristoyl)glucosamine N-acyltransferase [Holophagales bacterium]
MPKNEITAQALAELFGGALKYCPPDRVFTEVLPLEIAKTSSISFLANHKYAAKASKSGAGLILVGPNADLGEQPVLVVKAPYWALAQCAARLHPEPMPEFSCSAVHPTAKIGLECSIAPISATIGARTVIGNRVVIHPGVHIAEDCIIGDDCELFPGVVIYRKTKVGSRVRIHANSVLGSDGYGYALHDGRHNKVPQIGWVEVADDVEIGACTTIDRGALGPTRVGPGTKIDNLCQIAHNVQVGSHCLIVSQTGISGSTTLGDYVTMAGKVGTSGHIHIGSRSIISGNSMVAKDVPDGSHLSGYLARPHKEWMESQAAVNRLPKILKRLKDKTDSA